MAFIGAIATDGYESVKLYDCFCKGCVWGWCNVLNVCEEGASGVPNFGLFVITQ